MKLLKCRDRIWEVIGSCQCDSVRMGYSSTESDKSLGRCEADSHENNELKASRSKSTIRVMMNLKCFPTLASNFEMLTLEDKGGCCD